MKASVWFAKAYDIMPQCLYLFKREELRDLARKYEVPIGRNKAETISNLIKYRFQIHQKIIITIW